VTKPPPSHGWQQNSAHYAPQTVLQVCWRTAPQTALQQRQQNSSAVR
jgi:hypothetical protein